MVNLDPKAFAPPKLQSSQEPVTNLGVIYIANWDMRVLQFLVSYCFTLFPPVRGLFSSSCAMAFRHGQSVTIPKSVIHELEATLDELQRI